jgi:Trypsin-like peptidase domain
MPLLHPALLDSVVAIGAPNSAGQTSWFGTAFFAAWPDGTCDAVGKTKYRTFMVTNRHVIEEAVAKGYTHVVARTATSASLQARDFNVPLIKDNEIAWLTHPQSDVDLAALPFGLHHARAVGAPIQLIVADQHFMRTGEMQKAGVSEGDGVFLLGFSLGIVDGRLPTPIVRGTIARVRDTYVDPVREFMVDAPVFPGGSGGPVFLKPEILSLDGTAPAINRSWMIGIARTAHTWDHSLASAEDIALVTFRDNAGLCSVITTDKLAYIFERDIAANPP